MAWARSGMVGTTAMLLACAGAPAAAPAGAAAPVAAATLPDGWWIVDHATGSEELAVPGSAWRFSPGEYDVARGTELVERQRTDLHAAEAEVWQADVPSPFTVRRGGIATLTITAGRPPSSTVTLRPARPEETDAAERALAQHGTLESTCARAVVCFREATLALSVNHDDHREMAEGTSLRNCEQTLAGFTDMFARLGRALPDACASTSKSDPP